MGEEGEKVEEKGRGRWWRRRRRRGGEQRPLCATHSTLGLFQVVSSGAHTLETSCESAEQNSAASAGAKPPPRRRRADSLSPLTRAHALHQANNGRLCSIQPTTSAALTANANGKEQNLQPSR